MKHKVTIRKQCLLEQVDACCVQTKTMNSNTQHTHTSSCSSWQIPARLSIARRRQQLQPNTHCRSAAPAQPRHPKENTRNRRGGAARGSGCARGGHLAAARLIFHLLQPIFMDAAATLQRNVSNSRHSRRQCITAAHLKRRAGCVERHYVALRGGRKQPGVAGSAAAQGGSQWQWETRDGPGARGQEKNQCGMWAAFEQMRQLRSCWSCHRPKQSRRLLLLRRDSSPPAETSRESAMRQGAAGAGG